MSNTGPVNQYITASMLNLKKLDKRDKKIEKAMTKQVFPRMKNPKEQQRLDVLSTRHLLVKGENLLVRVNHVIELQKRDKQKEARKVLFAKNTTSKAPKVDPAQLPFDFEKPTTITQAMPITSKIVEYTDVFSSDLYEEKELVNHPSHYGGDTLYETIKVMENTLTREEFIGAMKFNIYKYNSRMGKKEDELLDSNKATWYQNYLNDFLKRIV